MKKWSFYAIIFLTLALGLKLTSEAIEKRFYSVAITAPVNTEENKIKAQNKPSATSTLNANTSKTVNQAELKPSEKDIGKDTTNNNLSTSEVSINLESINKMSASELECLNGVGPVLAKRIYDYKIEKGPFKTVNDLLKVKGIGEKKLQKIKEQIKP